MEKMNVSAPATTVGLNLRGGPYPDDANDTDTFSELS